MNRTILFTSVLFLFNISLCGQNLIKNGGFEEYIKLPVGFTNFDLVSIYNPGNNYYATPDFFHKDTNYDNLRPANSYFGKVDLEKKNENAIAGLITYKKNRREYITFELTKPLEKNKEYKVCFSITNGIISKYGQYGIDSIQVLFSSIIPSQVDGRYIIPQNPQLSFPVGIQKKWLDIQTKFTLSEDNIKFLTIGNFRKDNETHTIKIIDTQGDCECAYYFLDNVFVVENDTLNSKQKHIVLIVDNSASLRSLNKQLPGCLQEIVKQHEYSSELKVSLITFDDSVDVLFENKIISNKEISALEEKFASHPQGNGFLNKAYEKGLDLSNKYFTNNGKNEIILITDLVSKIDFDQYLNIREQNQTQSYLIYLPPHKRKHEYLNDSLVIQATPGNYCQSLKYLVSELYLMVSDINYENSEEKIVISINKKGDSELSHYLQYFKINKKKIQIERKYFVMPPPIIKKIERLTKRSNLKKIKISEQFIEIDFKSEKKPFVDVFGNGFSISFN